MAKLLRIIASSSGDSSKDEASCHRSTLGNGGVLSERSLNVCNSIWMKIVNRFSLVGVRPLIPWFDCIVNIVSTETVHCLTMTERFTCRLGGYLLIHCWVERTRWLQGCCGWLYGWGHRWTLCFWCVTLAFIAWARCNILLFWRYRWHTLQRIIWVCVRAVWIIWWADIIIIYAVFQTSIFWLY